MVLPTGPDASAQPGALLRAPLPAPLPARLPTPAPTLWRGILARILAALCLFLAALPAAFALDPAIGLAGYRHDRWSEIDGTPNLIDALAQTDDGWLWVASRRTGLFRFDGVRFIPFATVDGSTLQNVGVSVLQPGLDNTLWIGHGKGGVSLLRDARLRHVLAPDKTGSVFAIALGVDGSTWAASNRGLYQIRAGVATSMDASRGYPSQRAEYVMADRQGRVWASDGASLFVLRRGASVFERLRPVERDPMLIEAPDGSVWIVLGKRFERLTPPATPANRSAWAATARGNSYQSAFDGDANLWSGNCPVGICVVRPAAWQGHDSVDVLASRERLGKGEGLTGLTVLSVLNDREGNLWIGTSAGLDRLRDQAVHMVDRLFDQGAVQALPHPAGYTLALATQRLNGGHALWRIDGGAPVPMPNPDTVHQMAQAPDGSLVLASEAGIERQSASAHARIALPPVAARPGSAIRFRSVAAGNDQVWANLNGHGTWRWRAGRWTRFTPAGLAPTAITIDAGGRTYIGYEDNRVHLLGAEAGGEPGVIAAAPGVDIGAIKLIHAGRDVVVAGSRGLGVIRNGRIEALRFALAQEVGAISAIAQGPDGDVWLNASRALLRVRAGDWRRSMGEPDLALNAQRFDALDGYAGGSDTTWLAGTAIFARDGKLWLAGERGLAWLAPAALRPNPVRAEAQILELMSSGRRVAPAASIELGKGTRDVQISYSAPSLAIPQRVTFRYRMLGVDPDWVEAGARRTAFYNNLAPGAYTFEVLAVNDSGLASRASARMQLRIEPLPTQTWWSYALCTLSVGALLYLLYRWRLRHLAARLEERFNIRTHERESVARGLHDTLLQSLQGLLYSMQAVVNKLPPETAPRREFDSLLERVQTVLVEGRDEVKGLRSEFGSSSEFWEVLLRDVDLVVPAGGERVRLEGAAALGRLERRLHHNVYAVVREAVFNALRHTAGPVTVATCANLKQLTLSVSDRGPGLGQFRAGKHGHYGLQGMYEHAAQIGARLRIADRADGGTEVVLSIPAALAYADAPGAQSQRSDAQRC